MALPYPSTTLALIFLVIVPMALGRATFAEANEEAAAAGKKHAASANNATAPANPSPVGHRIEASENSAANGRHVGGDEGQGHHPPGKGHHDEKSGGHRKKGGHCKKGEPCKKGGHRKKGGHPATAPPATSPTIVVPPTIVPADAPASSPAATVAPPTAAPPTASPPTSGDRIQISPTLKKLLPGLPPSAAPQELKELISKATGVDPSKIPELSDPKQIEEVVAKTIGTNYALPPNTDAKQIENLISQATGMNATDALATVQESSDVESLLSKAMGSLAPSGDAGAAGTTPALSKEASSTAFSTETTSMAIALVAAVAVACLNF